MKKLIDLLDQSVEELKLVRNLPFYKTRWKGGLRGINRELKAIRSQLRGLALDEKHNNK